jgi:hypothetical protein
MDSSFRLVRGGRAEVGILLFVLCCGSLQTAD